MQTTAEVLTEFVDSLSEELTARPEGGFTEASLGEFFAGARTVSDDSEVLECVAALVQAWNVIDHAIAVGTAAAERMAIPIRKRVRTGGGSDGPRCDGRGRADGGVGAAVSASSGAGWVGRYAVGQPPERRCVPGGAVQLFVGVRTPDLRWCRRRCDSVVRSPGLQSRAAMPTT